MSNNKSVNELFAFAAEGIEDPNGVGGTDNTSVIGGTAEEIEAKQAEEIRIQEQEEIEKQRRVVAANIRKELDEILFATKEKIEEVFNVSRNIALESIDYEDDEFKTSVNSLTDETIKSFHDSITDYIDNLKAENTHNVKVEEVKTALTDLIREGSGDLKTALNELASESQEREQLRIKELQRKKDMEDKERKEKRRLEKLQQEEDEKAKADSEQIERLTSDNKSLKEEISALKSNLEKAKDNKEAISQQLTEANDKIVELENQLSSVEVKEVDTSEFTDKIKFLTDENKSLQSKISKLSPLERKVNELSKENRELVDKLSERSEVKRSGDYENRDTTIIVGISDEYRKLTDETKASINNYYSLEDLAQIVTNLSNTSPNEIEAVDSLIQAQNSDPASRAFFLMGITDDKLSTMGQILANYDNSFEFNSSLLGENKIAYCQSLESGITSLQEDKKKDLEVLYSIMKLTLI